MQLSLNFKNWHFKRVFLRAICQICRNVENVSLGVVDEWKWFFSRSLEMVSNDSTYAYLHRYVPTHKHAYVHRNIHMHICTCISMYIDTYINTWIHRYIHKYVHTYMRKVRETWLLREKIKYIPAYLLVQGRSIQFCTKLWKM
jgi:hypothetical protein